MESGRLLGINLLILRSRDIERLKDFYQILLGIEFEKHTDHGALHYGAQIGNVYMEIYPTKTKHMPPDSPGFVVDNLEDALSRVDTKHIHSKFLDAPYCKTAMVRDADNRLIHLTERR
jgi:predicted enzyme related to lactoylglutathione lyase